MLALLRSDLYRAWHRADYFWTLFALYVGVFALMAILVAFFHLPLFDLPVAIGSDAEARRLAVSSAYAASPTYLLSQTFDSGIMLALCASGVVICAVSNDKKFGFRATVLAGRGGVGAYCLEKFLYAGVLSALFVVVGIILSAVMFALLGVSVTAADSFAFIVAWVLLIWLTTWAAAALGVLFAFLLKGVDGAWFGILMVTNGSVEKLLSMLAGLVGNEALVRAVDAFASLLPLANYELLGCGYVGEAFEDGARLAVSMADLGHVFVCDVVLIVLSVAVALLVWRRRDVA